MNEEVAKMINVKGQKPKAVLIFGVGPLQESIIKRAKLMGLYTVGIDPVADAICRDAVDVLRAG